MVLPVLHAKKHREPSLQKRVGWVASYLWKVLEVQKLKQCYFMGRENEIVQTEKICN